MRKAQEIRNLDDGQLEAEVQTLRAQIFKLRTKDSLKQLDKTHEIKLTRRELAVVLTVMNERAVEKTQESAQTEESK
jgi:large subunit ribosomal protein L29